jgi:CHAT domain-containing protein
MPFRILLVIKFSLIIYFIIGVLSLEPVRSSILSNNIGPTPSSNITDTRLLIDAQKLAKRPSAASRRQSIEKFNKAIELFRSRGSAREELEALLSLAKVQLILGQTQRALASSEKALNLAKSTASPVFQGRALDLIGLSYMQMGKLNPALDNLNNALALKPYDDKVERGQSLKNLGFVYRAFRNKATAISYLEQALVLFQSLGNKEEEADVLFHMGRAVAIASPEKALPIFEKSLAAARSVHSLDLEASAYRGIGSVYEELGDAQKSINFYNKALTISREVGNRASEFFILHHMGHVYKKLMKYDVAISLYEQAYHISKAIGDMLGEAQILNASGSVYTLKNNPRKALEFYNQALSINKTIDCVPCEAASLFSMAEAHLSLQEFEKALYNFKATIPLRLKIEDKIGLARSLFGVAQAYKGLDDLPKALESIKEVIEVVEAFVSDVHSESLRASFVSSVYKYFDFYISLLMDLHKRYPKEGWDKLALNASERAKAKCLLFSLESSEKYLTGNIDSNLLQQEKSLRNEINQQYELHAQQVSNNESYQLKQINLKLNELIAKLDHVKTLIHKSGPKYQEIINPQVLDTREIQSLLDSETMLLEFALGENESFLWAVTETTIKAYKLPKNSEILSVAQRYFDLLRARNLLLQDNNNLERKIKQLEKASSELPRAGRILANLLFREVAFPSHIKRLAIVPDGVLAYIPFAALPILERGNPGSVPLINRFEITYVPSASVLGSSRKLFSNRKPSEKDIAIFADPVFTITDPRVKNASKSRLRVSKSTSLSGFMDRAKDRIGHSDEFYLPRLSLTRELANFLVPEGNRLGMKSLDFNANREAAMSTDLSNYKTIVFATHGIFNNSDPDKSGIMLSIIDEHGALRDGFIKLNDIYNMKLGADLVVLGACETGLGKLVKGEGLIGLTRGFMYAGSRRVMATLWKVDEEATIELIKRFFELNKQGKSVSASLREAQLSMMNEKRWNDPYYWSGLILQGDWKSEIAVH